MSQMISTPNTWTHHHSSSSSYPCDDGWVLITNPDTNPGSDDREAGHGSLVPYKRGMEWKDDGDCLKLKATLPVGTKMDDLKFEVIESNDDQIQTGGIVFLKLFLLLPADQPHDASSRRREISKSINLPEGVMVNPNEFRASMSDDGRGDGVAVLNITLPKLDNTTKSKKRILARALGVLAKVVTVSVLIIHEIVDDD